MSFIVIWVTYRIVLEAEAAMFLIKDPCCAVLSAERDVWVRVQHGMLCCVAPVRACVCFLYICVYKPYACKPHCVSFM